MNSLTVSAIVEINFLAVDPPYFEAAVVSGAHGVGDIFKRFLYESTSVKMLHHNTQKHLLSTEAVPSLH